MQKFMTISTTHVDGKKDESGIRFLEGGYVALGWYHQDFTGWSMNQIIENIKSKKLINEDEAIYSHTKFLELEIGDLVAPIKVNKGIFGIGRVISDYKFEKLKHDNGSINKEEFYSHYRSVEWLVTDYLDRKTIELEVGEKYWKPRGTLNLYYSIPNYIQRILESRNVEYTIDTHNINDIELFAYEGQVKEYLSNHKRIERKQDFVKKYKSKFNFIKRCPGCGMNPQKIYSIDGSAFFELHHIIQLSSRKSENPSLTREEDVILLCPNCHKFIHKLMSLDQKELVTLKELKAQINIL